MKMHAKHVNLVVFMAILMGFCGKTVGTSVTCEAQYGFLPCTTDIWGALFLIVVYQFLMSEAQKYISQGSDQFFALIGPGIFGASLFHVLGTIPMLFIIVETGLLSDDTGATINARMGMSVLAGSAVMSLTLIWPSSIVFGSYDLIDDDDDAILTQLFEEEESFSSKLTGYGVTTDWETSYTARIMLVSMIPFIFLQLPKIINSPSVTRVIVLITLILSLSFFIAYVVYQIFQPWIQNRRFDFVTQKVVKNKLLKLLSTRGKPNVKLIKDLYKGLDKNQDSKVSSAELRLLFLGIQLQAEGEISSDFIERIMDQFDISGDEYIQEDEFVQVLTKWLLDARKSLSKNDHNPLHLFIKHKENTDEEQPLIPKKQNLNAQSSIWAYVKALSLVTVGTILAAIVSQPLITNVVTFASATKVPSFLITYFIIPGAINIPKLLSTINAARNKTQRAVSLTLSQLYSGVFMNSMSSLSTFLLIVFIRDVPWDVSAEVLVVLIICGVMGVFTSTRTVFPLWTGCVVYLMYPLSLLMLYLLTVVWGWS